MGLDMYMQGEKFHWSDKNKPMVDGYPLEKSVVEIGYWRKHPDLHGYIVQNFAGGEDDCQNIELSLECLEKIKTAIALDGLPKTEGFFFGESRTEDKDPSIKILNDAIAWAKKESKGHSYYCTYRASW